jgi:hypothetical protein
LLKGFCQQVRALGLHAFGAVASTLLFGDVILLDILPKKVYQKDFMHHY